MQTIPIFLASDDTYAPLVAVTAYSILANTKEKIDFYVLDGGISEGNKNKIKDSLVDFDNYSIRYFDMSSYGLNRFPNLKYYSLNTFSRYFIPEIAPELGKVLYLDVDIIVNGDIAELYRQDLDGLPLGAVPESFIPDCGCFLKEKIWPAYRGGNKYFNAGIMVMDIPQIKKDIDEIIAKTIELAPLLKCPDQDILNIVFDGRYKPLDYRFNFFPDAFGDYRRALGFQHADKLRNTALINHYVFLKPWKKTSLGSDLFWKYAEGTLFYESLQKQYERRVVSKSKVVLFGFLEILKIEETPQTKTYFLFGALPFLKVKTHRRK